MASRPRGYGMTAELARKKDAKYDESLALEAMDWIQEVVGDSECGGLSSANDVHEKLKDGVVLCNLANTVTEASGTGKKIKVNASKMAFKQMENISNFLTYCENTGMKKADMFQTVDLYEKQNMMQVILGIHGLGRKLQSNPGTEGLPTLGVKESKVNKREFTEEQLRQGEGFIGLQAGSNKGASQAGQNFGKTRAIID